MTVREHIRQIPVLGDLARWIYRLVPGRKKVSAPVSGSKDYWEQRYQAGGNSGAGSYKQFADFKAEILNAFVKENHIRSLIEFGCGDGNQLELADYPQYLGVDVSETAVKCCEQKFKGDPTKSFLTLAQYKGQQMEMAMSLDVIYHLLEDDVFDDYMRKLFQAASRYVVVYSSDTNENAGFEGTHVRHRKFSDWISENSTGWKLISHIPNRYPFRGDSRTGSFADFFIYQRI